MVSDIALFLGWGLQIIDVFQHVVAFLFFKNFFTPSDSVLSVRAVVMLLVKKRKFVDSLLLDLLLAGLLALQFGFLKLLLLVLLIIVNLAQIWVAFLWINSFA